MKTKKLKVPTAPIPVVGVISPWNFPLILSLGDAIPALQAGAAVVIKPSEVTPLGLAEIVEAWKHEIGGPDVLDVVNGAARDRLAPSSTRSTSSSSPARTGPPRRC